MADHKLLNNNTAASPVTITMAARPENFAEAQDRIRDYLAPFPCSMRTLLELDMLVEEIFINIANYAYPQGGGSVWIDLSVNEGGDTLVMTFRDTGTPYDPLKKESPDITSPAEQRAIGGLGIFLVQKYSDALSYKFENSENRLTICKKIA